MYVLIRTDQGGGYVARVGNPGSYTWKLEDARVFATREAAEAERCKGNEQVVPVEGLLRGRVAR